MAYEVNTEAKEVAGSIKSEKIDVSGLSDVILLDDKPIDLSAVEKKIADMVSEAASSLESTENIEV